ncbi:MAG TPA: DUF1697 domain-containing protein [Allosphingosinicella sp.]
MDRFVALLRGINVGGHNKVSMADLRAVGEGLGWSDVSTYIQSGNLIFGAAGKVDALESALEAALAERFGVAVAVIARTAPQWAGHVASNPFPEAAEAEPNRLMLCLAKKTPRADCDAALQEKARDGEKVRLVGATLWIHYPARAGQSRLSPSLIDRLVGSPVTARNVRTALKLEAMLAA